MKVQMKESKQEFQPKTLTIEIETQEELEVLHKLFTLNLSVPDIVYPNSVRKAEELSDIMEKVFYSLTN